MREFLRLVWHFLWLVYPLVAGTAAVLIVCIMEGVKKYVSGSN